MTGKDLIIYILKNNLENESVFKDGRVLGFMTVSEAAVKMEVGIPTIYTWILQDQIEYIRIGETYFVLDKN